MFELPQAYESRSHHVIPNGPTEPTEENLVIFETAL